MSAEATSDRILPGGLLGYLEDFVYQQTGSDHTLILRGWILGGNSRVRSVILKQQKGSSVSVPYGLPRPDVAREYPHDLHARKAGFGGSITLARSNLRQVKVDICAVLEDGREIRCFSRSYTPIDDGLNAAGKVRVGGFLRTAAQKAIAAYRDGRLSLSPNYWFNGLKWHYYSIVAPGRPVSAERERRIRYRHALKTFFDSRELLSWSHENPRVSIVVVPSKRAELTLRCLRGLHGLSLAIELIIVDAGSSRETARLLSQLEGVTIRRQRRSRSLWTNVRRGRPGGVDRGCSFRERRCRGASGKRGSSDEDFGECR